MQFAGLEEPTPAAGPSGGVIWRVHQAFNRRFERFRARYTRLLSWALRHRLLVLTAFAAFVAASGSLFFRLGQDFFPQVDAGQIRLHVRAPSGTRIEETERLFKRVEGVIRETIPARELEIVRMAGKGLRNREIAERLFITEGTVKIHFHHIYQKLKITGRLELALYARDKGLV